MANASLRAEERRRQLTLLVLGGAMFSTTLVVDNERALFSPLGDVPVLGSLSPIAYAVTFGDLPTGGGRLPAAYAARPTVPGAPAAPPIPPLAAAAVPPAVPPFAAAAIPPAVPPAAPPALSQPPIGIPNFPSQPSAIPGGLPQRSETGSGSGSSGSAPSATPPVPEPATWITLLCGFAVVGSIMRRVRRRERQVALVAVSVDGHAVR